MVKVGVAGLQKGAWSVLERQERQLEGPLEDSLNFTNRASSLIMHGLFGHFQL